MNNSRKGRSKPFLLIIEGAQGSGKTTICNALKNKLTCTNFFSLSGLPKDSSAELVFNTRYNELTVPSLIKCSGLNIVYERSFFSDRVYQYMGLKPYTPNEFDEYYKKLVEQLVKLQEDYRVIIVNLCAHKNQFADRLQRNKEQYENASFSVESSIHQDNFYKILFLELHTMVNGIKFLYCVDNNDVNETVEKILDIIKLSESFCDNEKEK